MKKKVFNNIQHINKKTAVYLLILAIILAGITKDFVNIFVNYILLPHEHITIETNEALNVELKTDDKAREAYSFYKINPGLGKVNGPAKADDRYKYEIELIKSPTIYVVIPIKKYSDRFAIVHYRNNEEKRVYFKTREIRAGACKYYPFADSTLKLSLQAIIYIIEILAFFLILILLYEAFCSEKIPGKRVWEIKHKYRYFFIIWIALFAIAVW